MRRSKMDASIRVLIADDHPVVRSGLRALIQTESDMTVVGEAIDGEEAIEKTSELKPDIVLLDLKMPGIDGVQAIEGIRRLQSDARVLVLTSFAQNDLLFPAIKAGALGYLLKDSSPEELLHAIRRVNDGESSLHPAIARKLLQEFSQPVEENASVCNTKSVDAIPSSIVPVTVVRSTEETSLDWLTVTLPLVNALWMLVASVSIAV